jgi:hypothetical protein
LIIGAQFAHNTRAISRRASCSKVVVVHDSCHSRRKYHLKLLISRTARFRSWSIDAAAVKIRRDCSATLLVFPSATSMNIYAFLSATKLGTIVVRRPYRWQSGDSSGQNIASLCTWGATRRGRSVGAIVRLFGAQYISSGKDLTKPRRPKTIGA